MNAPLQTPASLAPFADRRRRLAADIEAAARFLDLLGP